MFAPSNVLLVCYQGLAMDVLVSWQPIKLPSDARRAVPHHHFESFKCFFLGASFTQPGFSWLTLEPPRKTHTRML